MLVQFPHLLIINLHAHIDFFYEGGMKNLSNYQQVYYRVQRDFMKEKKTNKKILKLYSRKNLFQGV